ncbi:MAG: HEPN domain-containing protein [Sulfitobacter sp.]|mgnify:CR=1 FL=1|uniref:HEPN domain-containing protein n=1 Tax=unclassified Sulfitobacter TaxID=196795 RepID=UPI0029421C56|nr:HEPN domain-containing protein [Sulfitobacter sp. LC.270.F.C4]WOI16659.1 HEPN domain-containing protein [Sulfitobacter sp. LC.270.F.C4]
MSELVDENFNHLRNLASDIELRLSGTSTAEQRLKNELAGMFAVTVAATYEGIIKDSLINYATEIHPTYGQHIEKDFEKLNARVSLEHLKGYSILFGIPEWTRPGSVKKLTTFHRLLEQRMKVVERRFRKNPYDSYRNIFIWRNAYAHERTTSATFKDVYESHRVAQYVVRTFVTSFDIGG